MEDFFGDTKYKIIYRIPVRKPSQKELQRARKEHQFEWWTRFTCDSGASFSGNFRVYAEFEEQMSDYGFDKLGPWEVKFNAKKGRYFAKRCLIDVTRLFKADYNRGKNEVMIVPKTINARTWIKNYKLEIFIQETINPSKPKKRKIKPKKHKRFYNQFSNNKNY